MPQLTTPFVAYHEPQPYVAIRSTIKGADIPTVLPPLVPEVFDWLERNNVQQEGPPFFRYISCTQDNDMVVEVGIPVAATQQGDGRVQGGEFPAGRYLTVTHMGDYSNLREAHLFLESWAGRNGLVLDQQPLPDGISWAGRTEFYVNDSEEEPDPEMWQTDIVFLLAEDE